ncbi:MAG: adenylyltransferase/cytidyltransferase family protein [Candidatus Micrarchaeota archaeon]
MDPLISIQRYLSALRSGASASTVLFPEQRRQFRVVLTGGVFDVIHPGHLHTLNEARKAGANASGKPVVLVVVVSTDENVAKRKGREPLHSAAERSALVEALKPVDLAIVGVSRWQDTLARVAPDVVVFGYDQTPMPLPDEIKVVHLTSHGANPNSKTGKVRDRLGF